MRFPHWQFFESLDDELYSLSRIVDFTPENYSTFSVHLARLYLSACSEIDVVAKLLCKEIDPKRNPSRINEYHPIIVGKYSNFKELKIEMPSHELEFSPWTFWEANKAPTWWTSHNNVKYERSKYFKEANLENLLNSAAGLLVLLVYLHQPELYSNKSRIQPDFKIMRIESKFAGTIRWGFSYSLPDFGKSAK